MNRRSVHKATIIYIELFWWSLLSLAWVDAHDRCLTQAVAPPRLGAGLDENGRLLVAVRLHDTRLGTHRPTLVRSWGVVSTNAWPFWLRGIDSFNRKICFLLGDVAYTRLF
jgi:hypothetical protein